MIDMVKYAENLIHAMELDQNAEMVQQDTCVVPKSLLHQEPCADCKGDGYHMMNVEGDALDMVNCSTCRGAGLISTWRHK